MFHVSHAPSMLIGRDKEKEILDRLMNGGKLSGGYLFFGESGVGKFAFAENFVRSLEGGAKTLSDALIIAPEEEKGSIGIDAVRSIRGFLSVRPACSGFRSVVVRDAENMTPQAQNAALKIAEEPPAHALLIFIASSPEALLPTLSSRLRRIHFPRVPKDAIVRWLVESRGVGEKEAADAARISFGRPAVALDVVSGALSKSLLPKDLKFETQADFRRFVERSIIRLYADKNNNWSRLGEFVRRAVLAEEYNVNEKLQLKSMPWIR